MNWQTRVTKILGSKYPIIQGAFGGFGTSAIAAPVSAAGGFGIITGSALHTPDKLREDIKKARSLTGNPLGVNITIGMCPTPEDMLDVAIKEKIPVIFTAAYRADDYGRRIHEAGLKWVHKVVTIKHALAAEQQGADAVVLVGLEGTAFKNVNQLPTLIQVTTAARMLKIPIIAAGGIADARGVLAALAMGAEGIYIGTRFLVTTECPIPERHKLKLVAAQPWDPEYRDRCLVAQLAEHLIPWDPEYRDRCLAPPKPEELQKVMGERETTSRDKWLQNLEQVFFNQPTSEKDVDWENDFAIEVTMRIAGGSLAVGAIDRIMSAREVIDSIVHDAEHIMSREGNLGRLLS